MSNGSIEAISVVRSAITGNKHVHDKECILKTLVLGSEILLMYMYLFKEGGDWVTDLPIYTAHNQFITLS